MKTACIIPIKKNSERVPGKNFKMLCSKRLYEFIIEHAIEANCFVIFMWIQIAMKLRSMLRKKD